jgi:hypothetical protein
MGTVAALSALKLLTLAALFAITAWLVSFLIFAETLAPHRWKLFLGGFAAIAIGEFCAALIGKKAAKRATTES